MEKLNEKQSPTISQYKALYMSLTNYAKKKIKVVLKLETFENWQKSQKIVNLRNF